MGRRKKDDDVRLTHKLPDIRVTRAEYELIEARAQELNMSKTCLLRLLIFEKLPKYKLRQMELIPPEIKAELCRQGGNLRNLYATYNPKGIFDAESCKRILSLIEGEIQKIGFINDHYIRTQILGGTGDDWQGDCAR